MVKALGMFDFLLSSVRTVDIFFHNVAMGLIGVFFFYGELTGVQMSEGVYGGIIYSMPAEVWSASIILSHWSILGVFVSNSPLAWWVAQSGNALQIAIYGCLGWFMHSAEIQSNMWLFASVYYFPWAVLSLARLTREMRYGS